MHENNYVQRKKEPGTLTPWRFYISPEFPTQISFRLENVFKPLWEDLKYAGKNKIPNQSCMIVQTVLLSIYLVQNTVPGTKAPSYFYLIKYSIS